MAPAVNAELGVNSMLCPLLPTAVCPNRARRSGKHRAPANRAGIHGSACKERDDRVGGNISRALARPHMITVGAALIAAVVVNLLVVSASALPERSVIWCVAATVMVAPAGSVEPLS